MSEGEDVGKMNCDDWHWYDKIHHPEMIINSYPQISIDKTFAVV